MNDLSLYTLFVLIIFTYMNPVADLFPSYIQVVIFLFFVLFSIKDKVVWSKSILVSLGSFFIFFISLVRCLFADQLNFEYYSSFQVVIERYQFFVYPIIFFFVIRLSAEKKRKILYLSFFSILTTVIVSFYYIGFIDPQAIRNTQRDIPLFGVGDFMLMYAMSISIGPLAYFVLELKKNHKKYKFFLVTLILMETCLILSNLVTSVIISVLSVLIMYIITQNKKMQWISITFISVLSIVLESIFVKFLYFIADQNLFYWSTNNKIYAIANLLSGNYDDIDTLTRREMLASWSLKSFEENPLFGLDWKDHVSGKIGGHMQWADDLGRYGIIGNIFIYLNYIFVALYTSRQLKNKFVKKCFIASLLAWWILGFLNPCLSGTNLMMIYVVIPSMEGALLSEDIQ